MDTSNKSKKGINAEKKEKMGRTKPNAKIFPNLTAAFSNLAKRPRGSPTDSLEEFPPLKCLTQEKENTTEMDTETQTADKSQNKPQKHAAKPLSEETINKLSRTVYLKGKDTNIVKAFATHKANDFKKEIHKKFGEIEAIEVVKDSIRIICRTPKQKENLLKFDELWNCKFTATVSHFIANQKHNEEHNENQQNETPKWKKVVIHKAPTELDQDYIKKETNAVWVHRITKKIDGTITQTPTVILAYEGNTPERVSVGLYSFKTEPYIPTPIRCNNCQKLGHKTKNCKNEQKTCARCAGNHDIANCTAQRNEAKCVNCGGPHSSAYKGCIKYKTTQIALKYTVQEGISYKDALQKSKTETNTATKQTNRKQIEHQQTESTIINKVTIDLITATAEAVQWLLKQARPAVDQTAILNTLATALNDIKQLQQTTETENTTKSTQDPTQQDPSTETEMTVSNGS